MIVCLCVMLFFATLVTGPDGLDWLARRRAQRDFPTARVTYLPSGDVLDVVIESCDT